jgi:hypothetical protein
MTEFKHSGGSSLKVDGWIPDILNVSDVIMVEYKGVRIELPQSIQDMMRCTPDGVASFNFAFFRFAESIIETTRKKYRISEEQTTPQDSP